MKDFFKGTKRTSHTISSNKAVKNAPKTSARRPSNSKPTDLRGRCASCGRK